MPHALAEPKKKKLGQRLTKGSKMAAFNWSNDLSSGNTMIDTDHKHLIDLVNKLNMAMSGGKGNTVLGGILNELIDYTVSHFAREEKLMKEINYADYATHKAEHDKLVSEVSELKRSFDSGAVTLSSKVYMFLTEWLNRHIKSSDIKLGAAARTGR